MAADQKERSREWQRRYRTKHPERVRSSRYKHRFGITAAQYDALVAQQNGVCAICRTRPDDRSLAVDHDHATGKVRGLLCLGCNTAIGGLKDSPLLARSAAEYLERACL